METAYKIEYEKVLNPEQVAAVMHDDGPMLIIAGAGSGKTRTLVHRVARLVESGVNPHRILLLTFTRKAAEEMLRRASELLDQRCRDVSGGTFHSFAAKVLRKHADALGYAKNFTIHDVTDSVAHIGQIRRDMINDLSLSEFPRPDTLQDIFSKAVNCEIPLERLVSENIPQHAHLMDLIRTVRKRYEKSKHEKNIMDYDDLLVMLLRLLREHEPVRCRIAGSYDHILVDEYQDTNRMQADILRLLACDHNNVVVVGDDSQSVYAFRGARHKNILEFETIFPGTVRVKLEENYRSVQPILDLTNRIIEQADERIPKTLFTNRKGGDKPVVVFPEDESDQTIWVVDKIEQLHRRVGIPLSEIAVLFRSGYHSDDLEFLIAKRRIPYKKFGGIKFLEAAHVKDVLAHLRIAENPADAVNLTRVVEMIPGVGKKGSAKIALQCKDAKNLEPLAGCIGSLKKKSDEEKNLIALLRFLDGELSKGTDQSMYSMMRFVVDYYQPILERKYDDYQWRRKDLDQMLDLAEKYGSLSEFLADVTLDPPNDDDHSGDERDYLTLSTVHSAKGLEWRAVFVIWATEGRFPIVHATLPEEIEEERRLFYVAATRAKDNLFITCPGRVYIHGKGPMGTSPSRFLDNMPERTISHICR